jgi:hypothetical protein
MLYSHFPLTQRRMFLAGLIGSLLLVLVMSISYSTLAEPYADDFCRASYQRVFGDWLSYVSHNYRQWTGRWAAMSIHSFVFPKVGIDTFGYNILLVGSHFLWFFATYLLLTIALQSSISSLHKSYLSAIICCVIWAGMPSQGEGLYWLTGVVEWAVPFFLIAACSTILASEWMLGSSDVRRIIAVLFCGAIAVVIAGINELGGLVLCGILLVGAALSLQQRRYSALWGIAGVFVIAIAGTAINVFAPGNGVRSVTDFPHGRDLFRALSLSFLRLESSPLAWLVDPRLMCLSVLLLTSPGFVRLSPKWARLSTPAIIIVPLLSATAVFAGHFALILAQGTPPPGRAMNFLYALFLFGLVLSLIPLGAYISDAVKHPNNFVSGINVAAAILLPLSLVLSPLGVKSIFEFRDFALSWKRELGVRAAFVKSDSGHGDQHLILDAIRARAPSLYFWHDLDVDANNWRNECYARYYGVGSVSVRANSTEMLRLP